MYCKYCGAENDDNASYCSKCGRATNEKVNNVVGDTSDIFMFLLSLLIPILGLILWLSWKNVGPNRASSCARGALTGLVINFAFCIILGFSLFRLCSFIFFFFYI